MSFHHQAGEVFLRQARLDDTVQVGLLTTFGAELRGALATRDAAAAERIAHLGGQLLLVRHEARRWRRAHEARA